MKSMKGQYFSFDAIIATVIMVLATTSLVAYWFGVESVVEARNNSLHDDAMRIAESLVTPGVPENWPAVGLENTYQIGLADGYANELNKTAIETLGNLANPAVSTGNYTAVGTILKAPVLYFIRIEQVGDCAASCINYSIGNESAQEADEVAVAHRGASIDSTPVRVTVYLGK